MSRVPTKLEDEEQQPACEFVRNCSYATGCACKDTQELNGALLPIASDHLARCKKTSISCSAKMYFGYTTIICMCMKRQSQPTP